MRFRLNGHWFFTCSILLSGILCCLPTPGFAQQASSYWDGAWTDAKSGEYGIYYDPRFDYEKSHGWSGVEPDPKFYQIPPPRHYFDVDPAEMREAEVSPDYAPHALAQFRGDVRYRNQRIPRGYYQIKLGRYYSGSVNNHTQAHPSVTPRVDPASHFNIAYNREVEEQAPYQTFVIKKLGKVVGVLPIQRVRNYTPPNGEKPPKTPVATIMDERGQPTLYVTYKRKTYITPLYY
ncbi:MAG: hypothetical protein KTR14_01250 [Vampirovibrio sp.]|nr:hypothetical protein [Vampirovibrio sp.]